MRKICAITANRADFSRIESILRAIQKRDDLELHLVVMGSHLLPAKGYTIDEIIKKGFVPEFQIDMEVPGGTPLAMTKSVGLAITKLAEVMDSLRPDIAIVPVDRFESLAMGVTAALMNIYVAHIQGGEVTGTIDESIRHALTKLAHLHFVATAASWQRVIKMGEPADMVFNVGCPATDLLLQAPEYSHEETLNKLNGLITGPKKLVIKSSYIFVLQHPVTTEFTAASDAIMATLEAIRDLNLQVIIGWPNIDAGGEAITKVLDNYLQTVQNAFAFAHIPTDLFVNVLRHASCQIGNSSSGIREAGYFGTPVINIGSRQNSRERGHNVVDVGYNAVEIKKAIQTQLEHGRYPVDMIYGDGTAGEQIAAILAKIKLPSIQKKLTY